MRLKLLAVTAALLLAGCAETYLSEAESVAALQKVSINRTHGDVSTLQQASRKAATLSYSYLNAANKVTTVQQASEAVAILSAGLTVHGTVTGASDVALANRALPGLTATIVASRYGNQKSIQAIHAGAQRLNCISGKAGIAHGLGALRPQEYAAVAATRAAILDAQIKTRIELVRDDPSFGELFNQFNDGIGQLASENNASNTAALTKYTQELAACVAIEPRETPGAQPDGENLDVPLQQQTSLNQTDQGNDVLVQN